MSPAVESGLEKNGPLCALPPGVTMRKYEPFAPPVLEEDPGVSLNVPLSAGVAGVAAGAGAGATTVRFFLAFLRLAFFLWCVTQRFAAALTPSPMRGPATVTSTAVRAATTSRSSARLIGTRPGGATRP